MQSSHAAQRPNTRLAFLAGFTMIAITAIQFVAARFSLRADLTAVDIASLRFAGAGLVFLPVLWWSGWSKLKVLGWRRAVILAGLIGLPYPILINWGLTYAPAAHAAALCPASIVFFSSLLGRFAFGETITTRRLLGIALIIGGLLLFILPSLSGSSGILFGDLLFAGSGIMFATYGLLVRHWGVESITATAAVSLLSCLPLPLMYLVAPSGLAAASATEIAAQLVIQGLLAGAAAIFLYTYAVRQLGPQIAALFLPCVPVATAFTGMVVLGEVPGLPQFIAMLIMTAGMVLPVLLKRGET